jgi:hypothetical protein
MTRHLKGRRSLAHWLSDCRRLLWAPPGRTSPASFSFSRSAWNRQNPDRNIGATLQTLPGASFVVGGAAQASDFALVPASAKKKWLSGWSAATFEGEFSQVTRTYAGKGVVRYAW